MAVQPFSTEAAGESDDASARTVAEIRAIVQRLRWPPAAIHQFIADHCQGKRWSQLDECDRIALLYWLRQV